MVNFKTVIVYRTQKKILSTTVQFLEKDSLSSVRLYSQQTTQISGASRAFEDSDTDLILNDAEINLAENNHHHPGGDAGRRAVATQPNSTQVSQQ